MDLGLSLHDSHRSLSIIQLSFPYTADHLALCILAIRLVILISNKIKCNSLTRSLPSLSLALPTPRVSQISLLARYTLFYMIPEAQKLTRK